MCPVVLGSVHGLPIRRAVYLEGCLYVCFPLFLVRLDQLLLATRWSSPIFIWRSQPLLRYGMYDLEGSNNVDPLVSGFGQIYLTVKYICPVVLLSVLIFSKQTRACAGILLPNMSVPQPA